MMRPGALTIAFLLGSCAATQPGSESRGPPVELSGALPGAAQRCLMLDQFDSLRVSQNDPHTLVYGSGRMIWANQLGQCSFGRNDVLVMEPTGSQLCGGDIVRSFDRNSRIPGPSCVLSEFVPYRR
ncbi:MAG TPA: hypothetical protein VGU01_12470 [Sphingomicrobium sp.]|nr:hypothetical protein [Sphingomicrobium sp.]